jgi:O-antigen ligase/polysaccharide polymerase Wzy-like membrane protein
MPAWLVIGAVLFALAYIVLAPLDRGFAVFLAVIVLVPATLIIPNGITHHLSTPRLAVGALALRVIIGVRRGEVSADVLRPTPVHLAFYLFLAIALVNGVLLASPQTSVTATVDAWLTVVEQFLVFVVVLAVARAVDDKRRLFRIFIALIGVSTLIAVFEHFTHVSWSRALLLHVPGQGSTIATFPLEQRGGGVRVRAAYQFSLAYGWVGAMVLPVVTVAAVRSRRWLVRALPLVLLVTVYWSNSRSAFAGIGAAAVVLLVAGRERTISRAVVVALVIGGLLWIAVPSIRGSFQGSAQSGSTRVREQRLPEITAIVKNHAYAGLGLTGLVALGFPSTDAIYVLYYAELGVIGLVGFVVLLVVLLVYSSAGLRGPPSPERVFATAVFGALVAAVIGAAAFDLFTESGPADLFWVIAALGVVFAERDRELLPTVRVWWRRLAVAPLGLLVGLLLAHTAPTHADLVTPFDALPLQRVVTEGGGTFLGDIKRNTVCGIASRIPLPDKAQLSCEPWGAAPGFGQLRVDAPTLAGARKGTEAVTSLITTADSGVRYHSSMTETGRPTWARTAPVSFGIGFFLVAVLCPLPPSRRAVRTRASGAVTVL